MSIKTNYSGQLGSFILQGLPQHVFMPAAYTNVEDALAAGAPIVSDLLGYEGIDAIEIVPREDGVQIIQISLAQGYEWNQVAAGTNQSLSEIIAGYLEGRLYTEREPLIAETHQRYYRPDFIDELNRQIAMMVEKGDVAIKEHGGRVKATAYNPAKRSLVLIFGGACTGEDGKVCPASQATTGNKLAWGLSNHNPGSLGRGRVEYRA